MDLGRLPFTGNVNIGVECDKGFFHIIRSPEIDAQINCTAEPLILGTKNVPKSNRSVRIEAPRGTHWQVAISVEQNENQA